MSSPNVTDGLTFENWQLLAGDEGAKAAITSPSLSLTDVWVTPESRYRFEVVAGTAIIIAFLFADFSQALDAQKDLGRLLPKIEAIRWRRPI